MLSLSLTGDHVNSTLCIHFPTWSSLPRVLSLEHENGLGILILPCPRLSTSSIEGKQSLE